MARFGRTLTAAMVALAAGGAAIVVIPASASAVDPNDSITLTGTSAANGLYAGYPFSLTGSYDDADDNASQANVIFLPTGSQPSLSTCPDDYQATLQAIEMARGEGPTNAYQFEVQAQAADPTSQTGTFTAPVNTPFNASQDTPPPQNLEQAGTYDACAYLLDGSGTTVAVSRSFTFTVKSPKAKSTGAEAFGGPTRGPNNKKPSDLTLKVAPTHAIRNPGNTIIKVSGKLPANSGALGAPLLTMTVKSTRTFNGCAGTSTQDYQLARSSGGGIVAFDEQLNLNSAGRISADVNLRVKKRVAESGVLCAYVLNSTAGTDLAVGYYRFTLKR